MHTPHTIRVKRLADQVKNLYAEKRPFYVYHGSTNSARILEFKKDQLVDVSGFKDIVKVDTKRRTVTAESNVPMDKLVRATLKHGFLPEVVMEFPGITVGGAIQGNGGESSSFRYGTFDQTSIRNELVLADGTIIEADAEHYSDLFQALPGTAGSIAMITAATLRLTKAKHYVTLTYIPVHSYTQARRVMREQAVKSVNFIDGIVFSKNSGVIIVGKLSDRKQNLVRFSRAHDQWYYLHVQETFATKPNGWSESVPIKDYLFRYDRGAFWVGRFAFEQFGVPYTRLMRWLLNPILHTRKLYQALQESGASQQHIVQDIALPAAKLNEFAAFIDKEHPAYPIWLCPMKVNKQAPFQLNCLNTTEIINVGVWGNSIPSYDEFLRLNRAFEQKTIDLGGRKWTYAHSYFTKAEFWKIYDKAFYEKLRRKYNAKALPTMFDKTAVKRAYPVAAKKAVIKTIFGISRIRIR